MLVTGRWRHLDKRRNDTDWNLLQEANVVKALYTAAAIPMVAPLVNSIVLAAILWEVVPGSAIISWVAANWIVIGGRYVLLLRFRQAKPGIEDLPLWGRRFNSGLAISGVFFGSAGFFLYPYASLPHKVFLAFILGGMVAGAAGSYNVMKASFLPYSIFVLTPVTAMLLFDREPLTSTMGYILLLFFVIMMFSALKMHAISRSSVELNLANKFLSDNLERVSIGRKLAREKQTLSESHYRAVFDGSPVGILSLDSRPVGDYFATLRAMGVRDLMKHFGDYPGKAERLAAETRIIDANEAAVRMYATDTKSALLQKLDLILVPEAMEDFKSALAALYSGRRSFETDSVGSTLAGDHMDVNIKVTVLPGCEESLSRLIVSIEDITARKVAERNLEAAKNAAESASEAKSTFLANVSHELRTPLNAILGFTGIILQGIVGKVNEEQEKQLNLVKESGQHLLNLINEVLDLSRIEAGKLELKKTRFSLVSLVRQSAGVVGEAARARGVELRFVDLPPDKECQVTADEEKIHQVLLNLLTNAIKFSRKGGWVRISINAGEDETKVSVCDTGIGIPGDELEKIFEPFYRVTTGQAGEKEGTGLGLTLARSHVELHGGRLWARSDGANAGACFYLTLPKSGGV